MSRYLCEDLQQGPHLFTGLQGDLVFRFRPLHPHRTWVCVCQHVCVFSPGVCPGTPSGCPAPVWAASSSRCCPAPPAATRWTRPTAARSTADERGRERHTERERDFIETVILAWINAAVPTGLTSKQHRGRREREENNKRGVTNVQTSNRGEEEIQQVTAWNREREREKATDWKEDERMRGWNSGGEKRGDEGAAGRRFRAESRWINSRTEREQKRDPQDQTGKHTLG